MGELANDMIEGLSCSLCGIYFEEEHSYPVLCEHCYKEDKGSSNIPKATNEEL